MPNFSFMTDEDEPQAHWVTDASVKYITGLVDKKNVSFSKSRGAACVGPGCAWPGLFAGSNDGVYLLYGKDGMCFIEQPDIVTTL